LRGTLSTELVNLTALQTLCVPCAALHCFADPVPAKLCAAQILLVAKKASNRSENYTSKPLPDIFSGGRDLTSNNLTGPVPDALINLTALIYLCVARPLHAPMRTTPNRGD
jgi:hypothetical protein